MKKLLIPFFIMLLIVTTSTVFSASLTITQNFGFTPDGAYIPVDKNGVDDEPLAPIRGQGEEFDVTPTGFTWGGYTDRGWSIELDTNTRGGVTFEELIFKQNPNDSYAYTIMSSAGSNVADTLIDMTGVDAAMNFKISDIWDGNMGDGDNGSGLDGFASEIRATVLRAMIRDGNGDWFMSDLFCPWPFEGTSGELDGTIVDYTLYFTDTQWRKLPQAEIDNLNALAPFDEIALTRDPNVATPNLEYVSGFGVFCWNAFDNSNGQLAFTEISLIGEDVTAPEDVKLTQNFDKNTDATYLIDGFNLSDPNISEPEVPASPMFTTTSTGWTWGGYSTPEASRVSIETNTYTDYLNVTRTHDELAFVNYGTFNDLTGSLFGSYAYTIFDSTGGNTADSSVDLSDLNAAIELKISDIWHGWFGGQSALNGSGLPEPQNEVRATVVRAMIRDGAGNWYASELFCPSTTEITSTSDPAGTDGTIDGQILEHKQLLSETTWYQYSQAETDNLNALAGSDEMPLSRDPQAATVQPDLTQVTGMGLYIWSRWEHISSKVGIKEISLVGSSVTTPPEFWDIEELQDLADEWLKGTTSWQAAMDTDPADSEIWQLRNGTAGDYIISGGQMVILGNTDNWRLDTAPSQLFSGTTAASASMQATTVSADQTPVNRTGINLWLKGDIDETDGTLETNVNVVLEGDNTQYVEFISGWTGGTWPPSSFVKVEGDGTTDFDNTMLDIQVTITPDAAPATTGTLSYIISDQSGTSDSGSFTVERRTTENTASIHTVYSGGAQGVVDNISIESGYSSPYDRAGGDGFIDYLDFEWLGERWLLDRSQNWP